MQAKLRSGLFVGVCLAMFSAAAQPTSDPAHAKQLEMIEAAFKTANPAPPNGDSLPQPAGSVQPPTKLALEPIPKEVAKAYHEALQAHYEHDKWALSQRQAIYQWQYWAGMIVFVIAVAIVVVGMWMSWRQFRTFEKQVEAAAKNPAPRRTIRGHAAAGGESPPTAHQLEVSAQGVKISTPIIGVVILTLSLGFFYLYLKFVFTIE